MVLPSATATLADEEERLDPTQEGLVLPRSARSTPTTNPRSVPHVAPHAAPSATREEVGGGDAALAGDDDGEDAAADRSSSPAGSAAGTENSPHGDADSSAPAPLVVGEPSPPRPPSGAGRIPGAAAAPMSQRATVEDPKAREEVDQVAEDPTTAAAGALAASTSTAAAAAAAAAADLGATADRPIRPNDDENNNGAAAAEAPRRTAGSRECGNERCVACSTLLQHCTASNVSLEERLQQILLCRRVVVAAHEPNSTVIAATATSFRVNAAHVSRYEAIQEAASHRDAHDNQRHRDAVKGLLGLLKIDKRQQLSQWTGVPLETVHLVPKKKGQSNSHESPSASRDSPNIMTGAAQAERQAHGTLDQQWRDETQKVVGRYLAQKARDEQASRGETTMTERTEANSTGVNHDATPRWLREGHLGDESETRRAPRAADPARTSDRPNDAAGGPIQKRKDPNRERAIALKRAKTAAAVLPPKPRTELQRLEKETREAHERSLPPGHEDIKVRSFALEYNEWSVIAVAKWVNNLPTPSHGGGDDSHNNNNNNNRGAPPPPLLEIPTSPTLLRKCNVCTKFGHFDVLCPRLPPATSQALRADMDALIATWEESDDPAERVTELCEGYAIEQRNHAFDTLDDGDDAITTTHGPHMRRRLPTQVRVTELDHMVIQAAPTADVLLDFA